MCLCDKAFYKTLAALSNESLCLHEVMLIQHLGIIPLMWHATTPHGQKIESCNDGKLASGYI